MTRKLAISTIQIYKYAVSPLFGSSCRFYPSCSQYAQDAIASRGLLVGAYMTCMRLLRCHPWHAGGYDPVDGKRNQ